MPNNPVRDRYNPPGNTKVDFEQFVFSEVPVGELFWLNNDPNSNDNHAFRKLDETNSLDTKTQTNHPMDTNLSVYQKI